jgi:hypothetical protein
MTLDQIWPNLVAPGALFPEPVVGVDVIFACIGPALEIFSRHKRVERANGDQVLLREYLEHVWAAVSKQAQAHSALFPKASDEKRWMEGVLARKKGFGL